MLPFFEMHRARVVTILSDNGREYCSRPDRHPYKLFLQLKEIEHGTTKVRRPQSNGFIERFHRTVLEEHLRIQQKDLDAFLVSYNTKQPHQGRVMKGRAPYQAFKEGLPKKMKTATQAARKCIAPGSSDTRAA